MPAAFREFRYGARALRKSPALTVVAVLALTLGIGLTTTMFSIVYGALMKGLPFPEGDRIVLVQRNNLARNIQRMPVTIHDFVDYRAQQRSLEGMAGFYNGTVNVSGTEKAERFDGAWVSANTFRLLRVRPVLGRDFRDGEDAPGAERVAIIGYQMWKNRYDGNPAAVGTPIRANGVPYTIVGVMPEKFRFPENSEIWLPLQLDPLAVKRGEGTWVSVVARLKPGVAYDAASADVNAIARRLATEYKETNDGIGAQAKEYVDGDMGPEPKQLLYTMLGAVALVLLIACANVANLLLDRAAHRTKEVGIKTALGASRMTVVRQFLVEALLLSAAAAALGLAVAQVGITLFNRALPPDNIPFYIDIRLHPPVLLFTVGLAFLASLVAGALPAYQSSRADISEILKDETRGSSSFRIGKMSKALVTFEIALSCGLLVAAGLTIKSIAKLRTVDYGFRTENIFTARVGFPATYTDTLKQKRFFEQLVERLGALPGVRGAALMSGLPGVNVGGTHFAVEGAAYATDRDYPETRSLTVTPGFFDTFGVRVLQGRGFTPQDRDGSLPVALVNQGFARKFFNGENPIGRRIRQGDSRSRAPWQTIVGVVPDLFAESDSQEERRPPMIFVPLAQNHSNFVSIAVHTAGSPMALTAPVRDAVASLDADIPIYWAYSMTEALARPTWFYRVFGTIFMIFGFVALFLASVGLYAVMAFSVSRRTREIGVRMALGAQARDVVRMLLRQGVVQLAVGMTVGLALAAGVSQVMKVILFDVKPRDPAIFASVVAVLTASGLLACLVPARRATRVDPLVALRTE